jgi:hypothetical protein
MIGFDRVIGVLLQDMAHRGQQHVRRRWFTPVKDGGLDLSEKRAYVREALHAVIISPAGKGVGSHGKFDPDLLQLVWRT